MITTRTAKQCGQADFGWLQARYTFSFGHYFDPKLLGFASLRVLNQEVLAPGPRSSQNVSQGRYPEPDSGRRSGVSRQRRQSPAGGAGDALIIATQPGVSYSEHNLSKEQSLTRMQLWLDACPQRENPLQQKIEVANAPLQLLASPDGE